MPRAVMPRATMPRSASHEVLEACTGAAGPSERRPVMIRSCSDNHLEATGKVGRLWDEDFASDFATAVLGLQGERGAARDGKALSRSPQAASGGARRGLLESLVGAVKNLSPPAVSEPPPKAPAVRQAPGETPQSRHMRRTLAHFGPNIAANALEAAAPPSRGDEPVSCPGEGTGEQFQVDGTSRPGTSWSDDDAENRAPRGYGRKRERQRGVCCAATGGSEVHANKMAHIRVPRHASKVLMMSLVGQTAKSIHG